MAPFAKAIGKSFFIFVLLFTSFFVLLYSLRRPQEPVWLKTQVAEQSRPFQSALSNMTSSFLYYTKEFFVLQKREEKRALESQVSELKEQVRSLEEVIAENERLKRVLAYKESASLTMSLARVLYRDPSNWTHTMTLDQGTDQSMAKGMAVISPDGVVGKLMDAAPGTSRVMLVTDPACKVSALIKRSRVIGTVTGKGNGMLEMQYLSGEDDVQVGDTVVSAGEGRIFPKGILIGTVEKVQPRQEGLSLAVEVRPNVDLSKLEEALIITKIE